MCTAAHAGAALHRVSESTLSRPYITHVYWTPASNCAHAAQVDTAANAFLHIASVCRMGAAYRPREPQPWVQRFCHDRSRRHLGMGLVRDHQRWRLPLQINTSARWGARRLGHPEQRSVSGRRGCPANLLQAPGLIVRFRKVAMLPSAGSPKGHAELSAVACRRC